MEKYQTKPKSMLDYTRNVKNTTHRKEESNFMNTMFEEPEKIANSTEDSSFSMLANRNTPQPKVQKSSPLVKPTIPSKRNKALENMLRRIQMREIAGKQQSHLELQQKSMRSSFNRPVNTPRHINEETPNFTSNYQNRPSISSSNGSNQGYIKHYSSSPNSQPNGERYSSEYNQIRNLDSNSRQNSTKFSSNYSQERQSAQKMQASHSVNSLIKRRTIQNVSRNSNHNTNSMDIRTAPSEKRFQPPPPIMPPKRSPMNSFGKNFDSDSKFQQGNQYPKAQKQINPNHIAHKNPKTFEITAKLNSTLNSNRRFEFQQKDSLPHNTHSESYQNSSRGSHNSISHQNSPQLKPLRGLIFPKSSSSSGFQQQPIPRKTQNLNNSPNYTERFSSQKNTIVEEHENNYSPKQSRFSASFHKSRQIIPQNYELNHSNDDQYDSMTQSGHNPRVLKSPIDSNESQYSSHPTEVKNECASSQSSNLFTLNRPQNQDNFKKTDQNSPVFDDSPATQFQTSYVQRKFTHDKIPFQSEDVYNTNRNKLNSALFRQNSIGSDLENNEVQPSLIPENSIQNMDPQERKTMIIEKLQFFEQNEALKHQILKILQDSVDGIADCQMLRKIKKTGRYLGSVALGMILYNMIESFGEDMIRKQYSHGSYVYSLSEDFRDLYQIALINAEDEEN